MRIFLLFLLLLLLLLLLFAQCKMLALSHLRPQKKSVEIPS